jgi:diguanylate cyclase (GGDEF)-like protein
MAQRVIRSSIGRLVLALMLLAVAPPMLLLWQMADRAHADHLRAAAAAQRAAALSGVKLLEELLAPGVRLAERHDLAWVARVIGAGAAAGVERRVLILDAAGSVLAGWPEAETASPDHPLIRAVLAAPAGAMEAVGLDGTARLVGVAHSSATGLVIAVSVPRAAVRRAADRRFAWALGLIALAGAAGIGIAAALARTLVERPLLALAEAADAVRRGVAQPSLPARAMVGEFETLKLAFAGMTTAIARRETALEAANAELDNANRLLVDLVERDALTGLANRRAFDVALDAAWSRGLREAVPVAVLIIDLDHFRQFNDRYGHLEGDACLMRVAGLLTAMQLRPYDLAARLGGEEFAVLLPDNDVPGAVAVGERIRAALHDMMLLHEGSPCGFVTASIGAASMVPLGPAAPRVLLAAADRALSAAKAAGRNRVSAGGWAAAA